MRMRRDATKYSKGDLILVQITNDSATGSTGSYIQKFKGPFRIRNVLINDRYEVEDMREGYRKRRTVVAADRIKLWIMIQGE